MQEVLIFCRCIDLFISQHGAMHCGSHLEGMIDNRKVDHRPFFVNWSD